MQQSRGGGVAGLVRTGDAHDDDTSPSDEWLRQLNATCNRLSTQYLQLLRAAGSVDENSSSHLGGGSGGGSQGGGGDHHPHTSQNNPRSGSRQHTMRSTQDPPPPPLAANVANCLVQCQLAAENTNVAASSLLTLIRTLQLSILLSDPDTMEAEQELECQACRDRATRALQEANDLEQTLMELRRELASSSSQ